MKVVRFNKGRPPYNAGELAGFEDQIADALVRDGTAAFHDPEQKVKEDAPPAPAPLGLPTIPVQEADEAENEDA